MNAIDIQARRALVFKYWCLELTPSETFTFINPKYPTSVETIRRDLRNMSQWLPQLTSLEEGEIDESMYRIMGQMRMAQKRVTALMFSNNDSVATGASKALHAMVAKEAELRMDLGRLHRVPLAIQHTELVDLEGLDERAIAAIVQNFMDDEARRLRMNEGESKPVDRSKSKDGETHPLSLNGLPNNGLPEWEDTSQGGKMAGGYSVKR